MKFGEVPVAEARRRDPRPQPEARHDRAQKGPGAVGRGSRGDCRRRACRRLPSRVSNPAMSARTRRRSGWLRRRPDPVLRRRRRLPGAPTSLPKRAALLVFDRDRVDRLNLVDEAITLGTLPPYVVVEPRQMVATVKIIPFAAPEDAVERCAKAACGEGPLLRVARVSALVGRADPDPAPRSQGKHPRQDPRGHRGPARRTRLPARFEERCVHETAVLARDDPRRASATVSTCC